MKAITIRGIDPEVAKKLKSKATQEGKSINQLTLEIIKTGLGVKTGKRYSRQYDDLDDLFGKWDDDQYKEIQGKIDQGRQIDQELWR